MTATMRMLLFLALAAFVPSVQAKSNWVWLGENARAEVYVDSVDLVRLPQHLKIWTLLSYKTRQRGGWLSERRLFMFACKGKTLEWQQSLYYAGRDGDGDLLHARTLTKYGIGDLRLVELDPTTKDKRIYHEAVPESNYLPVFNSLC